MNEDNFPVFTYFLKSYIPMEKPCSELMAEFKLEPNRLQIELKKEIIKLKEMDVCDIQAYMTRKTHIRMRQKQIIEFLNDIINGLDS